MAKEMERKGWRVTLEALTRDGLRVDIWATDAAQRQVLVEVNGPQHYVGSRGPPTLAHEARAALLRWRTGLPVVDVRVDRE